MYLRGTVSTVVMSYCLMFGAANAQEVADPNVEEAANRLGTVVVTAQHRPQDGQDVPISLTALDGDALVEGGANSIQDLAGVVPGLVVSKSVSYGLAPISIRGLGGPAGGGSLLTEQPVAVYVDDVYVPALAQSVSDFLDVDTLVVLRGPQGTLYGRNSTAGALLISSKRPGNQFGGFVSGSFGSFEARSASGAINIPLIDEKLAVRLAAGHNNGGDWADNTVDDRKFGGSESTSLRASLRFTPSDTVSADLILDHSEGSSSPATVPLASASPIFAGPPLGQVYAGNPFVRRADYNSALDDRDVTIVGDHYTETEADNVTALLEWNLDDFTLKSITGYRNFKVSGSQDTSPFGIPAASLGSNFTDQLQESVSQELRLSSNSGQRLFWTLGLYYFHQDTDAFIAIDSGQGGPPVATGFGPTGPIFAGRPSGTIAEFSAKQSVDSYAAFVDGTYDLTDQLSLTLGVRYSMDQKEAEIANLIETVTPTLLAGPVLLSAQCPNLSVDCEATFHNVSPRLVVNYQPTEEALYYASYSRGFNSGGFNNFGNVLNPADPSNPLQNSSETIKNYEVGSKNELFDGQFRLNLTGFLTDYEDLHIRQAVFTGGVSIVNVPEAQVKGVELESIWAPSDEFTLTVNGAYLDGQIEQGVLGALNSSSTAPIVFGQTVTVISEDVSGNKLTRSPEWQGFVSAQRNWKTGFGDLSATASLRFQAETYFLETNQETDVFKSGSWEEVDLRLALIRSGGLEISLAGRNVLDERHVSQAVPFFGFPIATLNNPRTWTISVIKQF